MGWAKYAEDNYEIMLERRRMAQTIRQEPQKLILYEPLAKSYFHKPLAAIDKLEDKYLICRDCGKRFLYSAKAQKYICEQGWVTPKRCKVCRKKNNARFLLQVSG